MTDVEATMRPWLDRILQDTGPLELYDAHTHIGQNDPDGYKQTPDELLAALAPVDARAVLFPMREPDGYPAANDVAIGAAADHPDRLVAFCRVSPHDHAIPRRGGRWTPAPWGSSCTRAPSSSGWTSRSSASSSSSRTSATCRC